jgi:RimJ/RimL family protein N-acetyltransferase
MTLLEETPSVPLREPSIPVLETARLILRAPHLEDAQQLALLANDRRIAENTARIAHPYRLADAQAFIAAANAPPQQNFLITLADATPIGMCGITTADGPPPEVGYWLGVAHWGKGYATEALHALVDYAFAESDCEALQAGARVTNPGSRRVLEKCGFQWCAVALLRIRALNSSVPIDRFRLERSLWASLKSRRKVG